jgi:hypothetical protein
VVENGDFNMRIAAVVALKKLKHPELFCPVPNCLWRTGGGYCPRHINSGPTVVHK